MKRRQSKHIWTHIENIQCTGYKALAHSTLNGIQIYKKKNRIAKQQKEKLYHTIVHSRMPLLLLCFSSSRVPPLQIYTCFFVGFFFGRSFTCSLALLADALSSLFLFLSLLLDILGTATVCIHRVSIKVSKCGEIAVERPQNQSEWAMQTTTGKKSSVATATAAVGSERKSEKLQMRSSFYK